MSEQLESQESSLTQGKEMNATFINWFGRIRWELQTDTENRDEKTPKYAILLSCQDILSFGANYLSLLHSYLELIKIKITL